MGDAAGEQLRALATDPQEHLVRRPGRRHGDLPEPGLGGRLERQPELAAQRREVDALRGHLRRPRAVQRAQHRHPGGLPRRRGRAVLLAVPGHGRDAPGPGVRQRLPGEERRPARRHRCRHLRPREAGGRDLPGDREEPHPRVVHVDHRPREELPDRDLPADQLQLAVRRHGHEPAAGRLWHAPSTSPSAGTNGRDRPEPAQRARDRAGHRAPPGQRLRPGGAGHRARLPGLRRVQLRPGGVRHHRAVRGVRRPRDVGVELRRRRSGSGWPSRWRWACSPNDWLSTRCATRRG